MNERSLSSNVMSAVSTRCHGATVIKHSDRATIGIPDISVAYTGRQCWVEDKYQRPGDSLKSICDEVQTITCNNLHHNLGGRSWIVVFSEPTLRLNKRTMTIWTPSALMTHLWPERFAGKSVAPEWIEWSNTTKETLDLDVMKAHRAITIDGWRYDAVAHLVARACAS